MAIDTPVKGNNYTDVDNKDILDQRFTFVHGLINDDYQIYIKMNKGLTVTEKSVLFDLAMVDGLDKAFYAKKYHLQAIDFKAILDNLISRQAVYLKLNTYVYLNYPSTPISFGSAVIVTSSPTDICL